MSTRIATTSLIPGATVIGHRGLGVLGSTILLTTADGDQGPGILYNDVQPGDEGKEFRAFVPNPPAGLALAEDGTFTYTGPATAFDYRLYVDGALIGTATATLNTGVGGAVALAGAASIVVTATADITVVDAVGTVTLAGAANIVVNATGDITVQDAGTVGLAGSASIVVTATADISVEDAVTVALAGAAVVLFTAAADITVMQPGALLGYSSILRTVVVYADVGAPLKSFTKQPGERLDYRFDFSRWLADCADSIASHSVVCSAPLNAVEVARMEGSIVSLVDGGENGKSHKMTCTITTTGGRIKEADIIIHVQEG